MNYHDLWEKMIQNEDDTITIGVARSIEDQARNGIDTGLNANALDAILGSVATWMATRCQLYATNTGLNAQNITVTLTVKVEG